MCSTASQAMNKPLSGAADPDKARKRRQPIRDAQASNTRAAIIKAATDMFVENGYYSTAVRDIAERANVTSGALIHHFRTKEQLFLAVFDQLETEMLQSAHSHAVRTDACSLTGLWSGIGYFLTCATNVEFQRIVLIEGPKVFGWDRWRDLEEGYSLGRLKELLGSYMDQGVVKRLDLDHLSKIVFSMIIESGIIVARSSNPKREHPAISACLFNVLSGICVEKNEAPSSPVL